MPSMYRELGVDVKKTGIEGFKPLINNLFHHAFCAVMQDPHHSDEGLVFHSDGAGSKPVQSYLQWKETGDLDCFKGLAQDVIAMNIDDIICVGACPIGFLDYIAANPYRVPKEELLAVISRGFEQCFTLLKEEGISLRFAGGETADLPDQLRTLDISGSILGRMKLSEVITGEMIRSDDVIIGLSSGGMTRYEKEENSGIMCNGITLARHCLIRSEYGERYPEMREPEGRGYFGRFSPDSYSEELRMTIGEAILSPTRLFTPVIEKILDRYGPDITGLIHNTGGGQTKCLRLGENIHYIKDDLPEADPIFILIQKEAREEWRSMYLNFNMGIGFEIIARRDVAQNIVEISENHGLKAQIIGRCDESDGKNRLTLNSPYGRFRYP